jgi:hypothetical protein
MTILKQLWHKLTEPGRKRRAQIAAMTDMQLLMLAVAKLNLHSPMITYELKRRALPIAPDEAHDRAERAPGGEPPLLPQ